jgi:ferredoxin-nitrite reductase
MDSRSSISLTILSFAVLACCTLHAGAFSPTIHLGYASGARALRSNAASKDRFGVASFAMSAHGAATKPGTGENRMTTTGFKVPLVEKVSVPSSQGYEWKVKADVLDAKKLNMQEKVKLAKPGLSIIDELEKLAAEAKEKGGAQHLDDDDITLRLKWMGLFHRGKIVPGTFMWRFRVPNGVLTSTQWRALGEVAGQYDNGSRDHWEPNGCADVTTRMNVQLRGIRLEDLPGHWRKLRSAGVFSVQSGMDNVRNLVGNPLAGIDAEEIIDTRRYCQEFTDMLTNKGSGNPDYTNLPRKFNVCYVGSKEMFEHPDINDIAYIPAKDASGAMGWNIDVGGLLTGSLCEFAIPLDAWVPLEKHLDLGHAILTTFRDYGYRYNPRSKSRLMFLINDMGLEAFRAEVAARYLERSGAELARAGASLVPKEWKRRELLGAHKQPDGHNWVGVRVPAGRLFADEMAAMADIADAYGSGEIRMTVEENVLFPNIPNDKLDACLRDIQTRIPRCQAAPRTVMKGTVSCTGNQFCGFANINTKGNAIKFAELLDAKFDLPSDVRIHWTGCPNTCGQIQIGDIGLLGTKGKDSAGKKCEAVDIYVGGGIGQTSAIGTLLHESVPIDEKLEEVLSELLVTRFGATPRREAPAAAPTASTAPTAAASSTPTATTLSATSPPSSGAADATDASGGKPWWRFW